MRDSRWLIVFGAMAIVGFMLIAVGRCNAADWTATDVSREVAWQAIHYADWMQTRQIVRQEDLGYWEGNPFLGKHPSLEEVNAYMATTAVLHTAVSHYIPDLFEKAGAPASWVKNSRAMFQYVTIGFSGSCVASNYAIGLKVSF